MAWSRSARSASNPSPDDSADGEASAETYVPMREQTRELVARLRARDQDTFQALYLSRYQRLWEYAYGFVQTAAAAEDIVHDVFANLWYRSSALGVDDTIDSYLYGAVRHRALNILRHVRMADRKQTAMGPDVGGVPGMGSALLTPDVAVAARDLDAQLRAAIAALPPGQQQVILLHWRHGLSNLEIARVMGLSSGAVAVQLLRAREALRRIVDRHNDG
jgi:RNA polymerase sigma-70 factor (ECF subfamily)